MYPPPSDKIRVALARNPPDAFSDCKKFPTFTQSVDCQYPGWCLEVLKMITEILNVTIVDVITPWQPGSVVWGAINSTTGEWTGTLGMLQNDEVDTICLMFQKTDIRDEYFDLANTIISVRPIYVVKQNAESYVDIAMKVFGGFNAYLWFVILMLFVVQIIFYLGITKFESFFFPERKHWNPTHTVWMLYEYFVDQKNDNDYPDPLCVSGKVTLTIWALCQCVVMSGLYKGILLSQLLNPTVVRPFDNIDQMVNLIQSHQYSLTTNNMGNWYFDELQFSMGSHYVKLREATKNNPVVATSSVAESLDLVETGKYIYPIQEDSSAMQFAKKRCGMTFISEGLPEKTAHFIFQKNSSWIKPWNEQIVLTQQFQQRTFRKYFEDGYIIGEKPKCPASKTTQKRTALDIWSISGILLVVIIGTILSSVTFCIELCVRHYKKKTFTSLFSPSSRSVSAQPLVNIS